MTTTLQSLMPGPILPAVRRWPLILGIPIIACADAATESDTLSDVAAESTDTNEEPHDFAFEIATHAPNAHRPQSMRVIEDRGGVDVMTGPQGLNMAILVPRILDPVTEPITILAQLESGPQQVGEIALELPAGVLEDGVLVIHDVYLIFTRATVSPDDYARLRVVLTDATGLRSEVRHTIRLLL